MKTIAKVRIGQKKYKKIATKKKKSRKKKKPKRKKIKIKTIVKKK